LKKKLYIITVLSFITCAACQGALLIEGKDYEFSNKSATGTIAGKDFKVENASISNLGVLTLRQGQDFIADREIIITFPMKEGDQIPGKIVKMGKKSLFFGFIIPQPTVTMKWQSNQGLKRRAFATGYLLVLEFGEEKNGYIPGKIAFQASWDHEDSVNGTFKAFY